MNHVAIALSNHFDGSENIVEIMARYHRKLEPLVMVFECFMI
jgi:hypothetical protein